MTTETWKQGGSTVRMFDFAYDDEGNTLTRTEIASGEVTEYEWDHRNRLVRIVERTSASGSITQEIEYIYDAFDQRVGKRLDSDGNGTWDRDEAYVWTDGQTHLRLTDADGEGTTETFHVASRYLYGDIVDHLLADEQYTDGAGPAADASTASTTAGETLWALVDHLGSVRDLVANSGVVREHVVYDSFGNRLVEQDYDSSGNAISSSHAEAVHSLFGYTGRDWDADASLQYNRARWYDPATGRWLSQDPIGFAAGDANLFRYVGNRPITATDPSGLEYATLDEEYIALGGPTYVESDYLRLRMSQVRLGAAMLRIVNNGRCDSLRDVWAQLRPVVLANIGGYRSENFDTLPDFFQRAVEDVENSRIITTYSFLSFGAEYTYSGLHGFIELFGRPEGDNGIGDCWLRMEMQRNNLLIRRLDVISNRIKEIRRLRPDLPVPDAS